MKFSREEKRGELARELRMRRQVFPNLIRNGKLSEADAQRRIDILKAVLEDYRDDTGDLFAEGNDHVER